MERNNNIEQQIREQFSAREIQPSAAAWDRLDAMLSIAEEKKARRFVLPLRTIGIAAAILVFVTLGTLWYTQTENPKGDAIDGVATKENTPKGNASQPNTIQNEARPATMPESIAEQSNQVTQSTNAATVIESHKPAPRNQNNNRTQQKAVVNQPKANNHPMVNTPVNQEGVAQNNIDKVKSEPSPKLIPNTTEQAVAQHQESTAKVKVSANSLLSEVDGELELTFREKVLKKVSKNYKEAKVALANRNYN